MEKFFYMRTIVPTSSVTVAERVLGDFNANIQNENVVKEALQSLSKLARTKTNIPKLLEIGISKSLHDALKLHPKEQGVQICGLKLIGFLELDAYNLVKLGVGDHILLALKRFQNSKRIQMYGFAGIRTLSKMRSSSEYFCRRNAGELCFVALEKNESDLDIQKGVFLALNALMTAPNNRIKLFKEGIPYSIVKSMKQFPTEEKIQFMGTKLLSRFGGSYCLIKLTAHESVFNCMQSFCTISWMVQQCCQTLKILANLEYNCHAIVDLGLFPVLQNIGFTYFNDNNVQKEICLLLWIIGVWDSIKTRMIQDRVHEYLLRLCTIPKTNGSVLESAFGVVNNLATVESNAKSLVACGFDKVVVKSCKFMNNRELLQERGISFTRNILSWKSCSNLSCKKDAMEWFSFLLKTYPLNALITSKAKECAQILTHY